MAKSIYPEFGDGHKLKITLPSDILNRDGYNFFTLTTIDPDGNTRTARLNNDQAHGIIAATCTKHRTRMMVQYYYSEKNGYLVCGTTNKSEAIQGLFVKYGDGGVDIEPIAHLYKNQVFQLAEHLGVIPEIISRAPLPGHLQRPRHGRRVVLPDALRDSSICSSTPGNTRSKSRRSAASWS